MMTHWIQDLMNLYISCWHSLIFFHIWPLDVQAFSGFSLVGPSISVVLKMPTLHCYWSEPLGFMVLLSPLCHSASSQKSNLSVKQYKTLVVSSHHPRPKHFYHITTFLGLCIFLDYDDTCFIISFDICEIQYIQVKNSNDICMYVHVRLKTTRHFYCESVCVFVQTFCLPQREVSPEHVCCKV